MKRKGPRQRPRRQHRRGANASGCDPARALSGRRMTNMAPANRLAAACHGGSWIGR